MSLLSFLNPLAPALKVAGVVAKEVGDRFFPKKMSEAEKVVAYAEIFKISEASTDSARKMFITEMQTQKQPWLIRMLNGLVRPIGGLGATLTEFYVIWGANLGEWWQFKYVPITLTTEQHIFLGTCVAFYFGSRLKETLSGVSTKR